MQDETLMRREFLKKGAVGVLPLALGSAAQAAPAEPAATTTLPFSVAPRPEDFGAVGDGKTNDTDAVQKAALAGPGGLHLTAGKVYLIDKLVIPQVRGWTLEGNGATLRKREDGDNYALVATRNHLENVPWVHDGIQIRNLNVDGAKVGEACAGIVLQSWNARLFNIDVARTSGDGVRMAGVTRDGTAVKSTMVNNWIDMVNIHDCGGHGIHIDDRAGNKCTDWYIGGGWIHGCKGWGVYAREMAGCQIGPKMHFYSNAQGGLFAAKWSIGTLIQGIYFEPNQTCSIPGGWRPGMLAQCYFFGDARLEIGFAQGGGIHKRVAVHGCNFSGKSHILHLGSASHVIEAIGCIFDTPEPFRKKTDGAFYATRCWADNQEVLIDGKV